METKMLSNEEGQCPQEGVGHQNTSTIINEDSSNIDKIISKIGLGSYQIKTYLILGFILMSNGAESLVLSILQNVLKNEWNLTSTQIESVGAGVFLGSALGSLVSGKISDLYGRRKPLIWLSFILYAFGMASAFTTNFIGLIITRSIYGVLIGIEFPVCFTYLTEITPKEVRGRCLVLSACYFTLGELLACFVSFFTLNGISSGNWQLLLVVVAQPAILCAIGLIFFMHESPRYLIVAKKDLKQGVDVLRKISGPKLALIEEDLQSMTVTSEPLHDVRKPNAGSVLALFRENTKLITLCLWPVWFVLALTYYGMVYILPQFVAAMDKNNANSADDLWSITLPALGELPSLILVVFIVEKDLFGRRKSMIAGFLLTALLCVFTVYLPHYDIWTTGARTVLNSVFSIAYPYTAELYHTTIRTTGLGLASACSRAGGILMPWITQVLFNFDAKAPFLGFAASCLVGCVFCLFIPYDTTNKELDFEFKKTLVVPCDKQSSTSIIKTSSSNP